MAWGNLNMAWWLGDCSLIINRISLQSKTSMNVLGVIFDSKLNWIDQVTNTINKTNGALLCIKQIKFYFTPLELKQLITTNVYSILYYNAEIWNIPTLHPRQKNLLMITSANALKICTPAYHDRMSFTTLHSIIEPHQIKCVNTNMLYFYTNLLTRRFH